MIRNQEGTRRTADSLLASADSVLCVVDVQEKLLPLIANREEVLRGMQTLIKAVRLFEIPILWTEQYPRGLGRTVEPLASALSGLEAPDLIKGEKTTFACFGCHEFEEALAALERRSLVLCGIETHICILQTALEALNAGFRVAVVADAVGSRRESNRELALARLRQAGAIIVSGEMLIMEWLRDARHPKFREILELVKSA